ncbi:MAG: hypothetical protein M3Z14_03350, partial [Candidatus Eremiobacteraeota bacterium]|nr:hypothetical protein [Candidatus Eremiobacteraeota bacterium]
PTGAFLMGHEWLKFGQLIAQSGRWKDMPILRSESLAACFEGSAVNPKYGLGFWLRPVAHPVDIVYASGSGGQALYIIPSLEIVAVHFGNSKSYRHETFVKRLLQGLTAPA